MSIAAPDRLQHVFDAAFSSIRQACREQSPRLASREVGTITSVSTGIATISGLRGVGSEELLAFPGGVFGIAFNVDEHEIGVVLLGDYAHLQAGQEVERIAGLVGPQQLEPLVDDARTRCSRSACRWAGGGRGRPRAPRGRW